NLFAKDRVERELTEEVRGYLEMLVETKIKQGFTPESARRAALIEMGGMEQVKENVREVRMGHYLETVWQDLRFGRGTVRNERGYPFPAIVALALAIGVNTVLFTLFNSVVLRPLPVPDPSRVVALYGATPQVSYSPFPYPDFVYYRDHNTSFAE